MSTKPEPSPPSVVVVVAEDGPLIRMVAVDALTDAGFVLVEATQADQALEILTSQAKSIKALFTDIQMPGGMTGLDLAHHVSSHRLWIALLIASGNSRPHFEEMPAGSRFLPKPYEAKLVISHIRELVDAR